MGISNICAIAGYGKERNPIVTALKAFSCASLKYLPKSQDQPMQDATATLETQSSVDIATTSKTQSSANTTSTKHQDRSKQLQDATATASEAQSSGNTTPTRTDMGA